MNDNLLIQVQDLQMHFPVRKGLLGREVNYIKAVDGVSFGIRDGETLGLVGESGCGKTTVARCVVRDYKPTAGQIRYFKRKDGTTANREKAQGVDLAPLNRREMRPYRSEIRMVFQDPYSSLSPRMTVFDIVSAPLRHLNLLSGAALEDRVATLLDQVGLAPEYMRRYPHAFSGGQRQRICIARALATNPPMLVADEAVSALDVSVRAQILNLLLDLQREFQLTYLFISHDLSVVKYIADRVAVMYVGKIVEIAPTRDLYRRPLHPYTESLLSAVPRPEPLRKAERIILEGDLPDPANPPSGCYFHTRCPYVQDICRRETPPLQPMADERQVACHFADELDLRGIATGASSGQAARDVGDSTGH